MVERMDVRPRIAARAEQRAGLPGWWAVVEVGGETFLDAGPFDDERSAMDLASARARVFAAVAADRGPKEPAQPPKGTP